MHFGDSGADEQKNVCEISISHTWDGKKLDHTPATIALLWEEQQRSPVEPSEQYIIANIRAWFFNDPGPPPVASGICPSLWDYEVVEIFFVNNDDQYLEVELGPHGHWLCYLLDGMRRPFNTGDNIELEVDFSRDGDFWICMAKIPFGYLPRNVSKLNAFAIHGSGKERMYEAMTPVSDGTFKEPDFHRLHLYESFQYDKLIPTEYLEKTKDRFKDLWLSR